MGRGGKTPGGPFSVAAQVPPLYDPSHAAVPGAPPQPLVSVAQPGDAVGADGAGGLEPGLQHGLEHGLEHGLQPGLGPHADQQQVTPWPVVYASDVQQQRDDGHLEHGVVHSPAAPFPAARAVQTVERVDNPGQYQPPPAVDIDSVKNNRPTEQGIPDVPPPPLPVGRGRKAQRQQPPPPGLLPF
ncbi:abl interactor 2-like [Thrips palmi]|uniref:Abl interactor 2-like n=1 Tax=Thrips palmi TaxID=161013 RepID=A0A6P8YS09_THRPL|nr:abl interactor 2-like [Thrips palmi]